ncbi:hypothetical protein B566_EDAN005860 [Ephemera danica]|nr:hypothetical protein B566_EDAN005860 [Ephemera danica]
MAGEVVVDALPYIDQGYDEPGVREAALAMVEEETRRYRPTKNYLEHLSQLNLSAFETEVMKTEFERMQQRQPMDLLSMKRYELPPPPAGKMTDIAAWNECVENSMAQLEHQATRICNLELMLDYGCEAWKTYLETLVQLETNWQRKNEQLHAGERLRQLEATWVGLVSKNYEIEQACAMLEKEVTRAKHDFALNPPVAEVTRQPTPERMEQDSDGEGAGEREQQDSSSSSSEEEVVQDDEDERPPGIEDD